MRQLTSGIRAFSFVLIAILVGCSADDSSGDRWSDEGQTQIPSTSCGGPVEQASGDEREYHCAGWAGSWACSCDAYRGQIPDPTEQEPDSDEQTCMDALEEVCGVPPDAFGACAHEDGLGRCSGVLNDDGQLSESEWSCQCAGDEDSNRVASSSCDQALIDHCAGTCTEDAHSCQPTNESGTYRCECSGESAASEMYGPTCDTALARACGSETSCEDDGDVCVSSGERDMWDCSCTSYYEASRTVHADSCEEARERACSPIGAPCNGWNGFCEDGFDESEDYGFFCTCNDGPDGFRTPEQVGGTDDCALALEDVCGVGEPPENFQCTKDSVDYRLICTQGERDGVEGYDCSCQYSCENSAGGDGTFIETDSCLDAIGQKSCNGC